MTQIRGFDPQIWCSSGVCGPSVEPWIAQFTADLAWLQGQGIDVQRYNLAHQPQEFAGNDLVPKQLMDNGAIVPWSAEEPVGSERLRSLVRSKSGADSP